VKEDLEYLECGVCNHNDWGKTKEDSLEISNINSAAQQAKLNGNQGVLKEKLDKLEAKKQADLDRRRSAYYKNDVVLYIIIMVVIYICLKWSIHGNDLYNECFVCNVGDLDWLVLYQ